MHYLLIYDLSPEYLAKRGEYRTEHLELAWQAHERGELVLGGALMEPTDTAILMFQGEGPEAAEAFAKNDPYVKNGLIEKWRVQQWMTVVGKDASAPVR